MLLLEALDSFQCPWRSWHRSHVLQVFVRQHQDWVLDGCKQNLHIFTKLNITACLSQAWSPEPKDDPMHSASAALLCHTHDLPRQGLHDHFSRSRGLLANLSGQVGLKHRQHNKVIKVLKHPQALTPHANEGMEATSIILQPTRQCARGSLEPQ